MNDQAEIMTETATQIPSDFLFDKEHPILPVPFTARIGDSKFHGTGMSVTAAYIRIPGAEGAIEVGSQHIVKLEFNFEGFTIDLFPEVRITGAKGDDVVLQFIDPAGPHLPQLRYILNSFIAGDFVSLGSMLSYTGPAKLKPMKSDQGASKVGARSIRRIGAIALSVVLIGAAVATIFERYTTSFEPRPVFVTRSGQDMRATSGGQISFVNPEASQGDVLYSISANSGDTLNFMMPCDCTVALKDGIYMGATVLPSDPILTIFDNSVEVRVQSQMSIEGLTKAMNGEQVYIDLSDGRSVPVEVIQTSATSESAARGELYLPVVLKAEDGVLGTDDIGKPARVRLSKQLFEGLI